MIGWSTRLGGDIYRNTEVERKSRKKNGTEGGRGGSTSQKLHAVKKKKLGIRERVVVVVHGYTRMIKRRSVFSHVIARNLLQKSKDRLENKEIYNGTRGRKKNTTKDNITMSIPYISVWLMHAWIHEILLLIMVWRARRWESNQLEEEKKNCGSCWWQNGVNFFTQHSGGLNEKKGRDIRVKNWKWHKKREEQTSAAAAAQWERT